MQFRPGNRNFAAFDPRFFSTVYFAQNIANSCGARGEINSVLQRFLINRVCGIASIHRADPLVFPHCLTTKRPLFRNFLSPGEIEALPLRENVTTSARPARHVSRPFGFGAKPRKLERTHLHTTPPRSLKFRHQVSLTKPSTPIRADDDEDEAGEGEGNLKFGTIGDKRSTASLLSEQRYAVASSIPSRLASLWPPQEESPQPQASAEAHAAEEEKPKGKTVELAGGERKRERSRDRGSFGFGSQFRG